MSIVLVGSTSGSCTLQEQAVAGNTVLTLPTTSGTIITTASTGGVSQAMLASNVASNGPAFSAYLGSNQTISTATWTKIQCNTEEFDTNSNYDNSTNYRFTPTVAGYYQFTCASANASIQTGIALAFYKNGSAFKQVQNTGSASTSTTSGTALIYCNGTTDYVEAYVYLNVGQQISSGVPFTFFQGAMVRAA